MNQYKKQEYHLRPLKLLAQSFGLLVCGFFLLFIIGEGIPDIINGKGDELIPFLPLVLLPIAGYILTWFKEWRGAVIMITGAFVLLIFFLTRGQVKAGFIYSIPFLVAGALFMLHIYKREQLLNKK